MKKFLLAALAVLALVSVSQAHGYRAVRVFSFGSYYAPGYSYTPVLQVPVYVPAPVEIATAVPATSPAAPTVAPAVAPAYVAPAVQAVPTYAQPTIVIQRAIVPMYETRFRYFRDARGVLYRQAFRVRVR